MTNQVTNQKIIMKKIEEIFFDAKGINILFISSKEKKYKIKVCKLIIEIYEKWNKKIGTSVLNRWFTSIWKSTNYKKIPGSLKFKYITQNKTRPPTFNIYHNKDSKVPKVTKRYIINRLRDRFGFEGRPIRKNLMTSKNPFKKK